MAVYIIGRRYVGGAIGVVKTFEQSLYYSGTRLKH
jgi:hypothetical protein